MSERKRVARKLIPKEIDDDFCTFIRKRLFSVLSLDALSGRQIEARAYFQVEYQMAHQGKGGSGRRGGMRWTKKTNGIVYQLP